MRLSPLNIFRLLWLLALLVLVAFTNMAHAAPGWPTGRGGRAVGVQVAHDGDKCSAEHCGAARQYNEFSRRK